MMTELAADNSAWALVVAIILAFALVAFGMLLMRKSGDDEDDTKGANGNGHKSHISYHDLVDPKIRGDHLSFNETLHRSFAGQQFVPVRGEQGTYIAFSHATCKLVLNDHAHFSSNPFPDARLVALNTMEKADHARVLRYVHGHYTQEAVGELDARVEEIIEKCTDALEGGEGGGNVVLWAKRIHMASSLARLGVDFLGVCAEGQTQRWDWHRVDELIALNDAMVALVAPLGGIGRRHSELPPGRWFLVLMGMLRSIPGTLHMFWRLGPRCAWEILRPDVTILFPPRQPRTGVWWHPELLPLVPRYFLSLHDVLLGARTAEGPLPGILKGVDGSDLRLAEALTLLVQLMVNMTTANALASMVFRLSTEAEATKAIAAEVDRLAPAFVQEVLRLDAPLQRNPRRVAKTPEGKWTGCPLKEGDHVLVFLGAANMDPAVFDEPARFRLDREESSKGVPLTFGSGMHYCLGSNMVKMEMRVALSCLLGRYEAVELDGQPQRLDDIDVGNWGFKRMQVRLRKKINGKH